jgi:apolipoprotein N-acyltransferase
MGSHVVKAFLHKRAPFAKIKRGFLLNKGSQFLIFPISILLSIFSGILLFASFPPFGVPFLVWIALIGLLILIPGLRVWQSFFLSLVGGMVFFIGIFDWILEVAGYTYLHHAILAIYLGTYFGIFGLAVSFISRRSGPAMALFSAPFIWVSLEYIRSNFFFLALPWGLLAHSQYQNPLAIQTASVAGTYGVSFLIVMANSALAALVLLASKHFNYRFLKISKASSQCGFSAVLVMAVVLLSTTLFYGHAKISQPTEGRKINLSLVQANIEQEKKWNPRYAGYIMQTHAELTREAANDHPDLIVWPEAATPRSINRDPNISTKIRKLVNETQTPLLLGSSLAAKFKKEDQKREGRLKNSAILIFPKNSSAENQHYDKISLMPFGEYLPHEDTIPWSLIKAGAIGHYLPGTEYTVFQLPKGRFSVTICWENLFSDLVRQFVKEGAQFIVNITNEAWFGDTAAPYQFLSMSVFRAVENRVYIVRCANTGISCFIDPCGRVVDRVKDENGRDVFVRGVVTGPVVPLESVTIYTRYGDWFIWSSFASVAVFLVFAIFGKPRVQAFNSELMKRRVSLAGDRQ